jgi:hypothetical protein
VSQLFPSRMGATQCHQQLLECCRRAGREGLDPEVKEQWMQLAEEWSGESRPSRARHLSLGGEIREAPEMNVQSNCLQRSRLVTNRLSCSEKC